MECEAGLNHLEVMKVPCRGWSDIRDAYAALYQAAEAGQYPYDTIVIDTVDRFVAMATEEVIARAKEKYKKEIADSINSLSDIPQGAGWYWQTELVSNAVGKFERLPSALVLIGHVDKKVIREGTREVTFETISIGGQTGINFLHWADHTLHIRSTMAGEEIRRKLKTKPTENLEAGSRGNVVPDGFELTSDMVDNYKRFRSLFD